MPDSQWKREWDKKNVLFVSTKFFREYKGKTNDQDLIDFLEGKQRGTIIKIALREYMNNHKGE